MENIISIHDNRKTKKHNFSVRSESKNNTIEILLFSHRGQLVHVVLFLIAGQIS